ncbi:hypothetical protein Tco_0388228 [Tanacetum coccineum]
MNSKIPNSIRLYCLGKDNGENIMKSIKEGPFQMGTVSDRVLNDLSAEEKERYKADIRATNILLQGVQSRLTNKPDMVMNDSVTSELARYKELVGE